LWCWLDVFKANRPNLIIYQNTRSNRSGPLYRNHFIFGGPRISHAVSGPVCLPTYFCSPFRSCNSRLQLLLGAIVSRMPVVGWWGVPDDEKQACTKALKIQGT
jgi:hypothetical protein